jgi:hypothetical protein
MPHSPPSRLGNLFGFALSLAAVLAAGKAFAHHGPAGHAVPKAPPAQALATASAAEAAAPASPAAGEGAITGQGAWIFRWNRELSELPEPAKKFLPGAHGGFAVDTRGAGTVYFALKGCGIIAMSPDLARKEIIEVDPWVREGNFHNTTVIYDRAGTPHLALPDDEKRRVYILSTAGKLVQVLSHPRGNPYYDGGGPFAPTDVEQAPSRDVFIVTGYSPGDYVVSAEPFTGTWRPLIFGGKGTEHGKLGTGHGITWNSATSTLDIADRPNSRIESFTVGGEYTRSVSLPAGSLPCDLDFLDGAMLVGCLQGPGGSTPAPIYIIDAAGAIVSTLRPHQDLGLGLFTHIHNATWHTAGEGPRRSVYILAQAWNPGGFAVLERVSP